MQRMAWREQIGDLVRRARQEAGLKQEALAELVGVASPSISHYENGRQVPRIEVLERIADATGKPLPWFFGGDPAGQAATTAPTSSTARGQRLRHPPRWMLVQTWPPPSPSSRTKDDAGDG